MGWLSKLFGSDGGGRSAKPENFEQWFEQYAALGFERQQQFAEETADAGEAEVDLGRGRLRFADGSEYGVQLIGSLAHTSDTWLWGWANQTVGSDSPFVQQSARLRQLGEKFVLPFFCMDKNPYSGDQMHRLGLFAVGMFGALGYYPLNLGDFTLLLNVGYNQDPGAHPNPAIEQKRLASVFSQLIAAYPVYDQLHALECYLRAKGYQTAVRADAAGSLLEAQQGSLKLSAAFDSARRLIQLTD